MGDRFKNKVAFITGGASGIGRDAAMCLAREGASVAIADWNEQTGASVQAEIAATGADVVFYKMDVTNYDDVQNAIVKTKEHFGHIDIAINSAGLGAPGAKKTADKSLEAWNHVIAVNQTGVFYCMKEQLKIMMDQGAGNIINISSIAGMRALPRQIEYVASKHAVVGMTKTAAIEYAKTGIRVNAVCPVFTRTPLVETMFDAKADLEHKLVHMIPVGRYGEVGDISNAILWLADEQSSFVTGLCLPIDGGMTA